ncbi:MAG TPA: hypothetical protein VFS43_35215 [Polyangiaceae bacterium]|nr:hypothetical protein [Polyangiaceae bacterium]
MRECGVEGGPAARLLWVLDEGAALGPGADMLTTEALMRALARRGDVAQELTTLRRISAHGGEVFAASRPYGEDVHAGGVVRFEGARVGSVEGYDAVLIRVDPPVTETFRHALLLLTLCEDRGRVGFINSPRSICARGSKVFNLRFDAWLPESLCTGRLEHALAFLGEREGDPWVAKPLDRGSGADVVRFSRAGAEAALRPLLDRYGFVLVQRFNPDIEREGELRCLVFDGAVVAAWLKRPKAGDFRSNLDHGATLCPIDRREAEGRVHPVLARLAALEPGFRLYSVDLIGRHLGEINVENVGGLPAADVLYGGDHAAELAGRIVGWARRREAAARP